MQETSNLRSSGNATSVVVAGSVVVMGVVHDVVTSAGSLKILKRCKRVVIAVKNDQYLMKKGNLANT